MSDALPLSDTGLDAVLDVPEREPKVRRPPVRASLPLPGRRFKTIAECRTVIPGVYPDPDVPGARGKGGVPWSIAVGLHHQPLPQGRPLPPGVVDKLRPFQVSGLDRSQALPGTLLFWRTGSGKSYGAGAWLAGLAVSAASQAAPFRAVVVTLAGAMPYQLAGDLGALFALADVDLTVTILEGQTPGKLPTEGVVVIPWSVLVHWYDALVRWAPRAVVFDEVQNALNFRVWRRDIGGDEDGRGRDWSLAPTQSGAAFGLAHAVPNRLCLTATPVSTGRMDLWVPLNLCEPGCWGTASEFGTRYAAGAIREVTPGVSAFVAKGQTNNDEFFARFRAITSIVRSQDIQAQLPKLRYETVTLTGAELGRPPAIRPRGPTALDRLHAATLWAADAKTPWAVARVVERLPVVKKMWLVTGRPAHMVRLADALREALGPDVPVFVYNGGAKPEALIQYQAAPVAVLVATSKAAGVGVNLHTTAEALDLFPAWTPLDLVQRAGRVQRIGGVDCTYTSVYAGGTIDTTMRAALLPRLADVMSLTEDGLVIQMTERIEDKPSRDAFLASVANSVAWSE